MEFIQHGRFILRKEDISYILGQDGHDLLVVMRDGQKFTMKFDSKYELDRAFNRLCLKTEAIPLEHWKDCIEKQLSSSYHHFMSIKDSVEELTKELKLIKKHLKLKDSNK